MVKMELIGDGMCEVNGTRYKARGKQSVIMQTARELIAAGMRGDELLDVARNGTQCFKPATLSAWAGLTIHEPDNGSTIKAAKYVPREINRENIG